MARRRLPHISIWRCASTLLILGFPQPILAEDSPIIGDRGAESPSTTLPLADANNAAVDHRPTVVAARAQWTPAQARVDQARAQTRLTLSFNSTASESNATNAAPPPDHETFGSIVNSI